MIAAIVRSFNNKELSEQVKLLLEHLDFVVVAVNVDTENRGEEKDGAYTKRLLENAFGSRIGKQIMIHPVRNWGKNPGSAAALNEAASELFCRLERLPTRDDILFNVSVESKIKPEHIKLAIDLFNRRKNLAVIGISRQIFIGENEEDRRLADEFQHQWHQNNRLQYRIPQNTAAFWRADLLRLAGGFRTECDFSGMSITVDGKEVPVAGMEDFPVLCYLVMRGYAWTMIEDDPMIWDLSDVKEDPMRWQLNLNKMRRQERVMAVWAKKFFGLTLKEMTVILESKKEKII